MTETEAIARLEYALHRWVRGREIMNSGMARTGSDWRDMSKRLMALDAAMFDASRFDRSPAVAALMERANRSMAGDFNPRPAA